MGSKSAAIVLVVSTAISAIDRAVSTERLSAAAANAVLPANDSVTAAATTISVRSEFDQRAASTTTATGPCSAPSPGDHIAIAAKSGHAQTDLEQRPTIRYTMFQLIS